MKFTKINDEPYSEEQLAKLKGKSGEWLREQRQYSGIGEWNETGDIMTIQFTKEDGENGIALPFQTNVTFVSNKTPYSATPKNGLITRLFSGELVNYGAMPFNEFLATLQQANAVNLKGAKYCVAIRDANFEVRGSTETVLNEHKKIFPDTGGIITPEHIAQAQELFSQGYGDSYRIDPSSDVRVVTRRKKDGFVYTAQLYLVQKRGMSSAPAIYHETDNVFSARILGSGSKDPLEKRL